MAFQRPFLISLKRGDSSQKWGFGIKGGKEYGEPLVIQTVAEDSLAERCGLRQGDEVIQVGRVNVQDLPLGQVYELMARCGNKIEMFVVREDLLAPRKGKEPQIVKAVVHNPYNSPLSLYSTENIADTLAKQTEVLTEGQISAEEDEGPESLSFKEKSAVFKFLEEQANQENVSKAYSRGTTQNTLVNKPKVAPPPPPKPKPPAEEQLYNGYGSHQQLYQDQQKTSSRVEYQTKSTQKVVNQYQQVQPVQYQQSTVYQVTSQQRSPGYQSPTAESYKSSGYHSPVNQYQQHPGYHSPTAYQQSQQINYQQTQGNSYQYPPQANYQSQINYQPSQNYQTPSKVSNQQPGYQSPTTYQQLNQSNYQQSSTESHREQRQHPSEQQFQQPQRQQSQQQQYQQQQIQQTTKQQSQQHEKKQTQQQTQHQTPPHQSSTAVSKAEFKIGPAPPPRNTSVKQSDNMTAVYRQQYEQHLQQQLEQQNMYMNNVEEDEKPKAHIINGNIFEHNSTSGTPITYKAPPAAPPKPHWPPPPSQADTFRNISEAGGMDVSSVWPPKRSTVTELPRTGFDPAAVRVQGNGRRCVWPPPSDEMRSGCNTPQSPVTGRRINWNPSPSPPLTRRTVHSPARRKDIQWPPPSPTNFDKENFPRQSPRLARKARFDDYVKEHASINVPQTYRPPPGTQHVEFY